MKIITLTFFLFQLTVQTLENDCGITFNQPNVRIIGGVESIQNSFPSMAFLEYRYKLDVTLENNTKTTLKYQSSCGGTLVR
jgi:hypothetical protein